MLEDQINHGTLVKEGFIDPGFVRTTLNEHASGADRTLVLWPVLALGLWLDRYARRS